MKSTAKKSVLDTLEESVLLNRIGIRQLAESSIKYPGDFRGASVAGELLDTVKEEAHLQKIFGGKKVCAIWSSRAIGVLRYVEKNGSRNPRT